MTFVSVVRGSFRFQVDAAKGNFLGPPSMAAPTWFVEAGDVHGHGNLIIFTDGSISDLKTVASNQPAK